MGNMAVQGNLSYLKYRFPLKHEQYLFEMQKIDNDRTSGTRFIQSLACMQKWAAEAQRLMDLVAQPKEI